MLHIDLTAIHRAVPYSQPNYKKKQGFLREALVFCGLRSRPFSLISGDQQAGTLSCTALQRLVRVLYVCQGEFLMLRHFNADCATGDE